MSAKLEALVEEVSAILEEVKVDTKKFSEKGNNAAGTRIRTGSMAIIKKLGEVRKEVSNIKNNQ